MRILAARGCLWEWRNGTWASHHYRRYTSDIVTTDEPRRARDLGKREKGKEMKGE